ncbi:MAG TPA: L-histidine N(alpha)-methyltransferase [Candidatus Acidoferrales bacterium]|nr:L-histidine N(alpha)-methyltransferase [Candidatus Acidoferrales bacterium]
MATAVHFADPLSEFAAEVRAGLSRRGQKELPSKYLYDSIGTTLFEVICMTAEYGLTRAEERLLRRHAGEIVSRLPSPVMVAELGSGAGKKTRWILESLCRGQQVCYYPIEISPTALAMCRRELGDIPSVSLVGCEREYLAGLREVAARRQPGQHLMVLFLGSTIGNFDREAGVQFLLEVRRALEPGDSLLLGADLEKPAPVLLAAYDDALGITAAFNRNLLNRINRELEGDFVLSRYDHVARYDADARRIEMHLRSSRQQAVSIPRASLRLTLAEGETIWTESSHKYSPGELFSMAEQTGFQCECQWIDREWPFAENLWLAQ